MKNWLLIAGIFLTIATTANAASKIAIVNMDSLFQQTANKINIYTNLNNEFQNRIKELQFMKEDLQIKIQHLQQKGSSMEINERNKLEKDLVSRRQDFSRKTQIFERDHQRRFNEERSKLIILIQTAIKQVANDENIDLVFDTSTIAFSSIDVKDITATVLNRLNNNAFN